MNVHGAPACVTVKVWPPIVIVPVRDDRAGVGGDAVAHRAVAAAGGAGGDGDPARRCSTAVQLQPVPAVTVTVPVAAADVARFDEVGAIVKVHGAPACVTVKVWPADRHRAAARRRAGVGGDAVAHRCRCRCRWRPR